jgi:hypothetical protein
MAKGTSELLVASLANSHDVAKQTCLTSQSNGVDKIQDPRSHCPGQLPGAPVAPQQKQFPEEGSARRPKWRSERISAIVQKLAAQTCYCLAKQNGAATLPRSKIALQLVISLDGMPDTLWEMMDDGRVCVEARGKTWSKNSTTWSPPAHLPSLPSMSNAKNCR